MLVILWAVFVLQSLLTMILTAFISVGLFYACKRYKTKNGQKTCKFFLHNQ